MKKGLRTEIIAVGTELLLGQIANTNAQWLSQQLATYGINTYYHTVVGDNIERLTSMFKQAKGRSNVVIISGGLGPTEDDMSREAFQRISQLEIVEHEASLRKIERFFAKQGIEMTPNNRRQARVFENSTILQNKYGMAPGNIVHYDNVVWIFLPGVPREMKQIFTDDCLPYLRKLNGEQIIESLVLRFIGIGESILEHRLQDLITNQSNPTIAPLSDRDGITIRLTAKASSKKEADSLLQEMKAQILERVGSYFYGENDTTIEEAVVKQLLKRNQCIAVAESLTGGLFQSKLVAVEGVSCVFSGGIVSYAASAKTQVLHVKKETIERYGTVSSECAEEMAKNISEIMDSDLGLSFTGVAGPDAIEGKEVGTIFISLYDRTEDTYVTKEFRFNGNRDEIRYRSMLKGFEKILNYTKFSF